MELLIRLVDKSPAEDASKRGDVIAVCPDGWAWSQKELTNPEWCIVRVPIIQSEHIAAMSPDIHPILKTLVRRRKYTVNPVGWSSGWVGDVGILAFRARLSLKA